MKAVICTLFLFICVKISLEMVAVAFWKKKEKKQEKKKDSIWKRIKNRIVIIMIFSMGIGFASCFGFISFFTGKNYISIISDLGKVVDTYYAIVDNYYGDLDKNALVDGAVNGMVSSVGDSFTSYSKIISINLILR